MSHGHLAVIFSSQFSTKSRTERDTGRGFGGIRHKDTQSLENSGFLCNTCMGQNAFLYLSLSWTLK